MEITKSQKIDKEQENKEIRDEIKDETRDFFERARDVIKSGRLDTATSSNDNDDDEDDSNDDDDDDDNDSTSTSTNALDRNI